VRQRLEARQSEKAAGALDGVDEPEDIAENLGVVRVLLETHELDVDHVEALVGLDQEFLEKIIHCSSLCSGAPTHPDRRRPSRLSVASRRLLSIAQRIPPDAINDSLTALAAPRVKDLLGAKAHWAAA
jgi:hypothetical protein